MRIFNLILISFLTCATISPSSLVYYTVATDLNIYNEQSIDVYQIYFNWGSDSQAATIKGCDKEETPLLTPEFDKVLGRNNPVAYVKGTRFSIKVKFTSDFISSAYIKANGTFGGLSETEIFFQNGITDWVLFNLNEDLPNYIKKHDVHWEWLYYDSNAGNWLNIGNTTHIIYALNKKPLTSSVFENLTRWTTKWCEKLSVESQEDDKEIVDAIIGGFVNDGVVRYGGPGWDTAEVLRTGDGMCGGMSFLFYDACATQGIEVLGMKYSLMDTSLFDPQVLWNGIVSVDPGIGRNEPGMMGSEERIWRWVDNFYPYPSYFGIWNEYDDVFSELKRIYIFYKFDGHVVNILEYNGEVLLYDLSFGKEPYLNTFKAIPENGFYNSSDLKDFRENYHDGVFDHMNGFIYYKNSDDKVVLDKTDFCVKTSIIPDEVNGNNQIRYYLSVGNYSKSKSINHIFDNNREYECFFKNMYESPGGYFITIEDVNQILKWLNNPSIEINWLLLRNSVLRLGSTRGWFFKIFASKVLNSVLLVNVEINVPEECSLPGFMSPLDMVKTAAVNSLVKQLLLSTT